MAFKTILYLALTIVFIAISTLSAFAGIHLVSSTGDVGSASLRNKVINVAESGDTIVFCPTINGDTITIGAQILISKDLVIIGNGPENTIIDGGGAGRLFVVNNYTVLLESMTITGGQSSGSGGAIFSYGNLSLRDVKLEDNIMSDNAADSGGAIFVNDGELTLENCQVLNNHSNYTGGAIAGGAISDVKIFIKNSVLKGNSASQSAGCILTWGDTLSIVNSQITGNLATSGAGVYTAGNTKTAIYNSTIVSNKCMASNPLGGGLLMTGSASVYMANTIIAKNKGGTAPDIYVTAATTIHDLGGNFIGEYNTPLVFFTSDFVGSSSVPLDPIFVEDIMEAQPTTTGNFSLNCNSLAIDAGIDTTGLGLGGEDLLGAPRIVYGGVDIGALENTYSRMTRIVTLPDDDFSAVIPGSFRYEMEHACHYDTIKFQQSMHPTTTEEAFFIPKSLVIIGNGRNSTILSATCTDCGVLEVPGHAKVRISALTVQDGNTTIDGGGIYNNGELTIDDVAIQDCEAVDGGGIFNQGILSISNSSISDNVALVDGGGIFNDGDLSINNAEVLNNHSDNFGGGLFNSEQLTVMHTNILNNSAETGGGLFLINNSASFSQCLIAENYAIEGGGVANTTDDLSMINCSITANAAFEGGGVINNSSGELALMNTTISGNEAFTSGGGIFNGTVDLSNCIVAKNISPLNPDIKSTIIESFGYNLIGDSSGVEFELPTITFHPNSIVGSPTNPIDPNFISDATPINANGLGGDIGDLRLWCNSPAIDAGNPATTNADLSDIDLNGSLRFVNTVVDIGASEYASDQIPTDLFITTGDEINAIELAKNIHVDISTPLVPILFKVEQTVLMESGFEVSPNTIFEILVDRCN